MYIATLCVVSDTIYHICLNRGPGLYFIPEIFDLTSIRAQLLLNYQYLCLIPSLDSKMRSCFTAFSLPVWSSMATSQGLVLLRKSCLILFLILCAFNRLQLKRHCMTLSYRHGSCSGSPPVAIVALQLSRSTNVSIERPCTWIPANQSSIWAPASILAQSLFEPRPLLKNWPTDSWVLFKPWPLFEPGFYMDI